MENKVQIRQIKSSDAKSLAKILSNKEVLKTLDPNHPFPVSVKYVKDKIPQDKNNWKTGKAYKFVIIKNNVIAGQISLYNPSVKKESYEIGYFIGYNFWNQGIATEAVKQICKFGFKNLGLKKVWSVVSKDNSASIRVLEKSGFTKISEKNNEVKMSLQSK